MLNFDVNPILLQKHEKQPTTFLLHDVFDSKIISYNFLLSLKTVSFYKYFMFTLPFYGLTRGSTSPPAAATYQDTICFEQKQPFNINSDKIVIFDRSFYIKRRVSGKLRTFSTYLRSLTLVDGLHKKGWVQRVRRVPNDVPL